MTSDIAEIRAFNRFYTRQIGLLEEHYVDSPLSLPEARVLYEIGARGHTTGAEIAAALGMDRGYLSRVIRRFTDAELVAVTPNLGDRRSNALALTRDGDVMAARLNRNSDDAVEHMVGRLSPAERDELVDAMGAIRRLLGDAAHDAPVILRPPRIGDLGWLVHRQGLIYNRQFGWNAEYETLIAGIYRDFALLSEDAAPHRLWVAERAERIVGSIFVVPAADLSDTAQLRMLYVEPDQRGRGIGRTLAETAVAFARDGGYARMRLWTHSVQAAARRIYEAVGFRIVESEPHHSFGVDLVSEIWEMNLNDAASIETPPSRENDG